MIADDGLNDSLSQHGRKRLAIVRNILISAFQQRQRQTARSWVEGVWLALGGAAAVSSRKEFDFIDDYFALLESFQRGETLSSMSEFEQAVKKLYTSPTTTACQLQVMTIHKAKGLEFDTVILPAMGRSSPWARTRS